MKRSAFAAVIVLACSEPATEHYLEVYGDVNGGKYILFPAPGNSKGTDYYDGSDIDYAMQDGVVMPKGCLLRLWFPVNREKTNEGKFAPVVPSRRLAICGGQYPRMPRMKESEWRSAFPVPGDGVVLPPPGDAARKAMR